MAARDIVQEPDLSIAGAVAARDPGTKVLFGWLFLALAGAFSVLGQSKANTQAITTVSAASFSPSIHLAAGAIAAGFGTDLALTIEVAPATGPLPTVLAETSVKIRDRVGGEHTAPLWFVSPGQINYYIPEETALGQATITVVRDSQTVASGTLQIDRVAPGLFTMNADGRGVPAGLAMVQREDGSQIWQYAFKAGCQVGPCQPAPMGLGTATDQVFLVLFGTGIRGRSSLAAVSAKIGGVDALVEYAGPVAGMVGLDQVNVRMPRSFVATGKVEVELTVDGRPANKVTVNFNPHNVSLSWTASTSPNVAGYNIYRGTTSGGPYAKLNAESIEPTGYIDATVLAGETHYYVATAVDGLGNESAYSNQAQAVIPSP